MRGILVSPVFVGRRPELAAASDALARATGGQAGLLLVAGEAGVGKSRLVAELVHEATAAGALVLSGQCVSLGADAVPLAPVVGALRGLARSMPPEPLEEALGPARQSLSRLVPEFRGGSADDGSVVNSGQLSELVLGVLERLSLRRPVVLVLEDLHWADRSTLELVAYLTHALSDSCVLLVTTLRSDEMHRRHPLRPLLSAWERDRSVQHVELNRFNRSEVADQLAAILDGEPEEALVDEIHQRSEGNAFLVEELFGVVQAGGSLSALPPSLRDVLLTRIDALSPEAQLLLRTASVAGRSVPEQLLAEVSGLEDAQLFVALRETVENNLLAVDTAGRGYTFRHALGRDAVYEDLLPGERARLHATYGEVLAAKPELADADAAEVSAALAHHWYEALELPRALAASVLAGREAMRAYAPTEAMALFERAMQIWPRVPEAETHAGIDPIELARLAADSAYRSGNLDRCVSLLHQALNEGPDTTQQVRLRVLLAQALRDSGSDEAGIDELRRSLALLPEETSADRAIVLCSLAASLGRVEAGSETRAVAEQAIAAARAVGLVEYEADALVTMGSQLSEDEDIEAGIGRVRAGLALAMSGDHVLVVARSYVNLSDTLELAGRHEEAVAVAMDGVVFAQRVGVARTIGNFVIGNVCESLIRLGRWPEAEELLAEALRTQPSGINAATLWDTRAALFLLQGRVAEAESDWRRVTDLVGHGAEDQFSLSIAASAAEIARQRGELAKAVQLVTEAKTVEETGKTLRTARYMWPLIWVGARVEADLALQARTRGTAPEPPRADLESWSTTLSTALPAGRGYRLMVEAEFARRDGLAAESTWQAAAEVWRGLSEPHPTAYALYRAAEAVIAAGDRTQARELLNEAASIADGLGARPLADDIAGLARAAGLALSRPVSQDRLISPDEPVETADELSRFGLTVREREILALVATGRTNPQIAKDLFISPKTVSVHVSNIFGKLGVTSRVEAAAIAYRSGIGR